MSAGLDLEAIRNGLTAIFEDISGVSDVQPVMSNRAVTEEDRPWVMPDPSTDARLEFKLVSLVSLGGGDEVRTEFDPDLEIPGDTSGEGGAPVSGGFTSTVSGVRVLTFSVKGTCYDHKKGAFEYLERVRSNLQRPSILDRIKALDLSLNDVMPGRDISYVREGRAVSCAVFDLVLNATSGLTDDPVTTIESVNTTHTIHA